MDIIKQIKAEVERLKIQEPQSAEADGYNMAIADVLSIIDDLLSFLSTLEPEKPMNQEMLEEKIQDERKKLIEAFGPMNGEQVLAIKNFAHHFYELGQQSKPKVRFPHEKDIVDKVFGAGNLDGWEYDEAKALVALAKEELLKDIKPKASEELDEEIERYIYSLGVGYDGGGGRSGW